jgi:hypothetical protein
MVVVTTTLDDGEDEDEDEGERGRGRCELVVSRRWKSRAKKYLRSTS